MKKKSDSLDVFTRFHKLVENYFNTKIKQLFSDNGGEYLKLATYLATSGISHLTSPPHTPEHNGYAERRHRHIVETSLALLSDSNIPTTFGLLLLLPLPISSTYYQLLLYTTYHLSAIYFKKNQTT